MEWSENKVQTIQVILWFVVCYAMRLLCVPYWHPVSTCILKGMSMHLYWVRLRMMNWYHQYIILWLTPPPKQFNILLLFCWAFLSNALDSTGSVLYLCACNIFFVLLCIHKTPYWRPLEHPHPQWEVHVTLSNWTAAELSTGPKFAYQLVQPPSYIMY